MVLGDLFQKRDMPAVIPRAKDFSTDPSSGDRAPNSVKQHKWHPSMGNNQRVCISDIPPSWSSSTVSANDSNSPV